MPEYKVPGRSLKVNVFFESQRIYEIDVPMKSIYNTCTIDILSCESATLWCFGFILFKLKVCELKVFTSGDPKRVFICVKKTRDKFLFFKPGEIKIRS